MTFVLCRLLGVHKLPRGIKREWSCWWFCARCGAYQRGAVGQ